MKAAFAYMGGKSGLAPQIVALMPEHRVYIEPFFGSGAVFFAKRPARHEIINDADHALVTFLRVMRTRLDELEQVCALTPHARDEFDAAVLDEPGLDELEVARRFWVRVNQSFGKTAGVQTGWSVTTGRTQSIPASIAGRLGRFRATVDRLMGVTIECCDGIDLIKRLATPDTVLYVDPPYHGDTRRSRKAGNACNDYRVDMGSDEDHRRLLEVLLATEATVFLAGYHHPTYEELIGHWDFVEWHVHAHGSNSVTTERGERVEVLWSNRPIAPAAQLTFDTFDPDEDTAP